MSSTDPEVLKAAVKIKSLFEDKYHRPRKKAFYIGQLVIDYPLEETAFEKDSERGYLNLHSYPTRYAKRVDFLYHHKYLGEQMTPRFRAMAKLIDRYSYPDIADAIGKHLEGLVRAELRAQGFEIKGVHTNEYQGKKWTRTNHDLDFIAEHRSQCLKIGVEVKNILSTPERDEIETKIDICHHLCLTPVFAVRWIKPYVKLISDGGGFSWFFKTQIYPPGFEKLVKVVWRRLSLPVNVRTDLPEGSIRVFSNWVNRQTS